MRAKQRSWLILKAMYPTLIFWLAAMAFALWQDGDFPDTHDGWLSFLLICVLIEFFLLKALLMARRMHEFVMLTTSLIVSNTALAIVFSFQQAIVLWTSFFLVDHANATTWIIRGLEAALCLALLWTIWVLANVPPPAPLDTEKGG